MIIRVICCGASKLPPPKRCTAEQFAAFCNGEAERTIAEEKAVKLKSGGYDICAAPGKAADLTAKLFLGEVSAKTEPLLSNIPIKIGSGSDRARSSLFWRFLLAIWYSFGAGRRELSARAKTLIKIIESENRNCVLICPVPVARVLLRMLINRNYVVTRSGFLSVKPLETFQFTKRDMHCGGCGNNCLLTSPGCAVGKETALKRGVKPDPNY